MNKKKIIEREVKLFLILFVSPFLVAFIVGRITAMPYIYPQIVAQLAWLYPIHLLVLFILWVIKTLKEKIDGH
jgi:tellurite resistance protein TehA-like permease